MKRKLALITILIILVSAGAIAQDAVSSGGLEITNATSVMYLDLLTEPFTFNGICPKDIVKITVSYYVPNDRDGGLILKESYVLVKYVPGSGTFIYRIHPDLNNLQEGTNQYKVVAERKDKSTIFVTFTVYYAVGRPERGGDDGGESGYMGAERGGGDDYTPAPSTPAERSLGAPAVSATSASGLQAGFADDNAQFNYFTGFLEKYGKDVKYTDIPVRERIVLNVTDKAGKPVPNAKVKITDGRNTLCEGTTFPDGTFLFFPAEYVDSITKYAVYVTGLGLKSDFTLQRDGKREIGVKLQTLRPEYKSVPLDILFILDTTGSMGEEISRLKATIEIINLNLSSLPSKPKVRFGMVLFRDRGDAYVTRLVPLTADLAVFQKELSKVSADGGGDTPEDTQAALKEAVKSVKWDPAGVRLAFLITDAAPHLDYTDESYTYADAARDANRAGIKIFSVGAGSLDLQGEIVLRQIAQYTYAKYIFLTYGERGKARGARREA